MLVTRDCTRPRTWRAKSAEPPSFGLERRPMEAIALRPSVRTHEPVTVRFA